MSEDPLNSPEHVEDPAGLGSAGPRVEGERRVRPRRGPLQRAPLVLAVGVLGVLVSSSLVHARRAPVRGSPRAASSAFGARLLEHALALKGVRYDFGGRLRGDEGIDCQGIIFYAAERLGRCDWRSWSVMPTRTLAHQELGAPVTEEAMRRGQLDLERLAPGDVLFFLARLENPKEPALLHVLTAQGRVPMWTWHMGLYAGDGLALHADPFTHGEVALQPLDELMIAGGFEALFATRPTAKSRPQKCRRGKRMRTVRGSSAAQP